MRAKNRIGAGPWSTLTLTPRPEPVVLTISSVTAGDGSLKVVWADHNDAEITAYDVRYTDLVPASPHPDSEDWTYARNITPASAREYTITGLTNGVQYQVQVRGRNRYAEIASDFSNWSDRSTGTPAGS